jgi:anti-sigma factor RsiW
MKTIRIALPLLLSAFLAACAGQAMHAAGPAKVADGALVGGRLLPGNSGPVAQFMYQEASGQRLTLYVSTERHDNRDTAFRFAQEGQINVFYWIDGPYGYALSAGIPKDELARIATAVYDRLDGREP